MIASTHRKHRAIEFKKFLTKIDKHVPDHLDIHVVCDNYGTHKHPLVRNWLGKHERFHIHFTPTYSSWINQVERLFAEVTRELLQRSDHRSVQALEKDLREWVKAWNEDPQPFVWTKTCGRDTGISLTTNATNYRRRTLGRRAGSPIPGSPADVFLEMRYMVSL